MVLHTQISVVIDGKKMCCGMQNPGPLVDFFATRSLAQLLAGVEMACQREALVPILQQKVNSVAVGCVVSVPVRFPFASVLSMAFHSELSCHLWDSSVRMKEASSGSLIIHSGMLCVFLDTGAEGGLELTCPNVSLFLH